MSGPELLHPELLRIAFVANIVILVPVCTTMFTKGGIAATFNGAVTNSDGLRLLVASLWASILAASVAGLFSPKFFAPVLLIQVVYKSLWLVTYVLPTLRDGKPIPTGVALVFLVIVCTYPILFWLSR